MDRRVAALILSLLAASVPSPLAAGCGGGDGQDEYRQEYRKLDRQLVRLGDDVGETIAAAPQTPDTDLARKLGELAERTGDLEDDLDGLDPPGDLESEHERLVQAVGSAQGALERLGRAVSTGSRQGAGEATVTLVEASRELLEAQRAIRRVLASEPG
jgi:hypothetical protein